MLSRILRLICNRDFHGSVSEMADAWDMDQSSLNAVVINTAGAGIATLLKLREKTGLALETLLGLDLQAIHLVHDEKVRIELANQPPPVPVESLAEHFEKMKPVEVVAKPTPAKQRTRSKSRTA